MCTSSHTVGVSGRTLLLFCIACLVGCGEQAPPVDTAPFEKAVAEYLERNNMAMALKQVKEGPTVVGDTATLTASLTHAELGGPAVTWTITFEKGPDGTWKAVKHED